MGDINFNLSGLKNIYNESLKRKEETLVFEIKQGKGSFNFLMFFNKDDVESKDKLFVFLGRTKTLIKFKLFGSHRNGDFKIYINYSNKEKIINELDLSIRDGTFNFIDFLEKINNSIPFELSLIKKIVKLREIWPNIKKVIPNIFDQSDKTILFGIKELSKNKHPQEKTLRKLYLFVNGEASIISELINELKIKNFTLAWTTNNEKYKEKGIKEILLKIKETSKTSA